MKRFLLFWTIIAIFLAASAQDRATNNNANDLAQREPHVTTTEALNIGYTFMRAGGGTRSGNVSKQSMQLIYTGQAIDSLTQAVIDCYYVFALQPKGFVIVAADERVEPILGYSYDNNFSVENMPDHVRGWLGTYEKQIEAVVKQDIAPEAETTIRWSRLKAGLSMSTRSNDTVVGPLLTTTWDQGQYYNALCPEDAAGPDGHVYTGCVATAMAQIINYHQYPQHGRGTHSYNSNYGTLTVNYDSANYDYTLMSNALTSICATAEVNAVAVLMRDCGVAVNMGYGSSESSAYDQEVRAALMNFFKFSPNMSFAEKAYFTNDEWQTMLRNDLDAGNPVYYSGQGTGGHAFVCDGYNADDYFSFNFGWGGYCNGWYLTSNVNPGGNIFNDSQSAIFGIVPDANGNVILGQMAGTSTFTVDEPLELYHLMGHNAFTGNDYNNPCNNIISFVSADDEVQLVVDIVEFVNQGIEIYEGEDTAALLRSLQYGQNNNMSPITSTQNGITFLYTGDLSYDGFQFVVSQDDECQMVSNVDITIDSLSVQLVWTENGTATEWEIEYGEKGFPHGSGTLITTTTNSAFIGNLEFKTYDFYIRSHCSASQYGHWFRVTIKFEVPYWQDIVTLQPEGYYYNETLNAVEISTAEGLAWWTKTGGLYDAYLTSDIDLAGYKWRSLDFFSFNGLFSGNGHIISNLDAGLFYDFNGTMEGIGLSNCRIKGGWLVGALCDRLRGNAYNCFVTNSTIMGETYIGGLIGEVQYGSVKNCYAKNVDVYCSNWGCGGLLVGQVVGGIVNNSYAAGNMNSGSEYCGGIVGYMESGCEISRCYSVPTPRGVAGGGGNRYVSDTSTFVQSGSGWDLLTPIAFDEVIDTNLLTVLNKGVAQYNDSMFRVWVINTSDTNNGFPVHGDHYEVLCPNVSDLSVQNVLLEDTLVAVVHWTEIGNASQWQIRYRRHDLPNAPFFYKITTNNHDTLYGILRGYEYDFNVRAVCDSEHKSGWGVTYTTIFDLPFWTDVVTTKPSGYVEDADGNVEISSAEGLAWFSVIVNGFHGQAQNSFVGKTVKLISDIDLDGYRWYPIGNFFRFMGTFDGNNHTISNTYVFNNDIEHVGLFASTMSATLKNVDLLEGQVISTWNYSYLFGTGGLVGYSENTNVINCHSAINVKSLSVTGALCGFFFSDNGTIIINSSATGNVDGGEGSGGLIGFGRGYIAVLNCYATGNVSGFYVRNGGLIGYLDETASVSNCYSIGEVFYEQIGGTGKVIGSFPSGTEIHYVYGQDYPDPELPLLGDYSENVSDTVQFHHEINNNTFIVPISIEQIEYTELLDALNAWVIMLNDFDMRTWIMDSITGYPVLGDYFVPSCYKPIDFTISDATFVGDTTVRTKLSWTQLDDPAYWEVMCVRPNYPIDSAIIFTVDNNPCVISNIPKGIPFDFYIRAVCDSDTYSGWSNPVTYLPDKLHWTDIVTEMPEGYVEKEDGSIHIYSAEGLAWLSRKYGDQYGGYRTVYLESDVDLSQYRWSPIGGQNNPFFGVFDGKGHVVNGLYCNELKEMMGLFGYVNSSIIKNLFLTNCFIAGTSYVGSIAGSAWNSEIINCGANGELEAWAYVGGLVANAPFSIIKNSFFNGPIVFRDDIYCTLSIGDFAGIVEGASDCDIENVYFSGYLPNISYSDIFTSSCLLPQNMSYCYGLYNTIELNLTSGIFSNLSFFTGEGTNWTLMTPPLINGEFYSDLLSALNAWVDANNSDGIYRRWAADSTGINGGYPVFATIPCVTVTSSVTIVACDSYTWHGNVYTTSTELVDSLLTPIGCDSIVTHYLIINQSTAGVDEHTACDSFTWIDGVTYTESTNFPTYTLTNAVGCDSVVTLHLTVNYSNTGDTTAVACDSFDWYEYTGITTSGDYNHTFTNASGCDSVVTLHLTVNYSNTGDTTAVVCDSYDWYEYTGITTSGDYNHTFTNASGCDSVVTLHLTVNYSNTGDTTAVACDSFDWYEHEGLTTSGDYNHTFTNAIGCDSVVTLHLIVNYSNTGDTTAVACDSYDWYEHAGITTSGDYNHTFTNVSGCDSVVTLHLTVNYSNTGDTTAVVCDSFDWYEHAGLTTSGDYIHTFTNATGCDSVVTLHLTVNYSNTGDTTAVVCDSYDCYEYTGITTSGDYNHTFTNVSGCDSVVTLHLTVNNSNTGDTTAVVCDSYDWYEYTGITTSGDYTHTFTNASGCDSVVTLHLTVNNSNMGDTTAVACDVFDWYEYTGLTTSGDYIHTFTNASGCDSVVTLHLTINESTTSEYTITTDEPCYTWNNIDYCESGDYTQTLQTVHGCDSVVTLHLTITVGIDDHEIVDFKVYPNPTNGILNVQCTKNNVQLPGGEIHIVDMYGKLVRTQSFDDESMHIDISDFANSVYFVKLIAEDKVIAVRKVVKQ